MNLVTIGSQNNAPTPYHPTHHVYCFHIDTSESERPFCFEEIVGGGHVTQGGAVLLNRPELEGWPGDWRDHLARAGCVWVAELIDEQRHDVDSSTIASAILADPRR